MTATAPSLTVSAPAGSHFEFEEVKTAKGTQSLGDVPILVWDDAQKFVNFYGEDGVLAIADGTSLRVSFQGIARRYRTAKKADDEIAKAQIEFRPGKRVVGASTPATRTARLAKSAIEKGVDADAMAKLIEKIASGQLDLASLVR